MQRYHSAGLSLLIFTIIVNIIIYVVVTIIIFYHDLISVAPLLIKDVISLYTISLSWEFNNFKIMRNCCDALAKRYLARAKKILDDETRDIEITSIKQPRDHSDAVLKPEYSDIL